MHRILRRPTGTSRNGDRLREEPLASAVAHWKTWFGRRDEIAARVLPGVVRWEWSQGPSYSLLPYRFERFPGRGRALARPPVPKAQHHESGLDGDGRLLVERVYDYHEEAFEAYVLHAEAATDIVEFGPKPHIPTRSERIVLEEGRVVRHESFRLNGYTPKYAEKGRSPEQLVTWLGPSGRFLLIETYRYEGPLLLEIDGYAETPGVGVHRYVDRFSYAVDGSLAGLDRYLPNGTVEIVYRPMRTGQGIDDLRRAAVAELVDAVIEVVRAAVPRGPVSCLELAYQEVTGYYPPLITLGFDRDRQRLREPDLVFRPMLSGGRTLGPTPDALGSCRQFDQEVRSTQSWSLGEQMLREAAAQLTGHDWSGVMEVTDDFVAFAVDPELTDLEDALRASATTDRILAWRARGWL